MQRRHVAPVHHVAIAAARRHARPLVADEDHAAAVGVEAVDLARAAAATRCSVTWKSLAWWHIMSSSATSRPNAKYSSMVPVPTVARVWPWRSPQNVLGSPGSDRADRDSTPRPGRRARAVMRALGARGGEREAREPGRRPARRSSTRTRAGRPVDGRARRRRAATSPVEPLAGIAPDVLGLDERVERLARRAPSSAPRRRAGGGSPPTTSITGEASSTEYSSVPKGSTKSRHSQPRSRNVWAREPGPPPLPVADGDVDAVAGIERAVGHRDHEALEPRPHLAARLEGERGHRRLARRLEPHRAVVRRRVGSVN